MDMDTHDAPSIRLTLPGRPEYVRLGRLALSGLAYARPLSAEVLGDLKLALTEACSMRLASSAAQGTYEIRYELHYDRLVVEVLDTGDGFLVPDEPSLSGPALGLGIIRALADELEVGPGGDGAGSRLRFVKRLDDRAPEELTCDDLPHD